MQWNNKTFSSQEDKKINFVILKIHGINLSSSAKINAGGVETLPEGTLCQLINNKLIMSPAPKDIHGIAKALYSKHRFKRFIQLL